MLQLTHRLLPALLALLLSASASAATRVTYYINDAAGTPVAATDQTGQVVWRATHLPYGGQIEAPQGRIGYTGHVYDESTGLVYMGARYYDPVAGRFMGMDPAGFDETNPQSFNRYAYANNSPYRYVDPNGEFPILVPIFVGLGTFFTVNNTVDNYANHASLMENGISAVGVEAAAKGLAIDATISVAALAGGSALSLSRLRIAKPKRTPNEAGVVREFLTTSDKIYYRVFSGESSVGAFLTAVKPRSREYALEAMALPRANHGEFIQEVLVPAGTKLRRSRAAAIRADNTFPNRRGGAEQFELLDRIPIQNFGQGTRFP